VPVLIGIDPVGDHAPGLEADLLHDIRLAAIRRPDEDGDPAHRHGVGPDGVQGLLAEHVQQPEPLVRTKVMVRCQVLTKPVEFGQEPATAGRRRSKRAGRGRAVRGKFLGQPRDVVFSVRLGRFPGLSDQIQGQRVLDGVPPLELPAQVHQAPDQDPLGVVLDSIVLHPLRHPLVILLLTFTRQHGSRRAHPVAQIVEAGIAGILRTRTLLCVGPPRCELGLAQGFLRPGFGGVVHRGPRGVAMVGVADRRVCTSAPTPRKPLDRNYSLRKWVVKRIHINRAK
jgi:hypothetical protein